MLTMPPNAFAVADNNFPDLEGGLTPTALLAHEVSTIPMSVGAGALVAEEPAMVPTAPSEFI